MFSSQNEGLATVRNRTSTTWTYYYYYHHHHRCCCLTAIGLTPGGSSIHLHTNSTQNTEEGTHITITREKNNNYKEKNWELNWEVRVVPRHCELYPGICLPTEEKAQKNSIRVEARTSQADTVQYKNNEQYNTQNKAVTQSSTMSQNNTEHRLHNGENFKASTWKQSQFSHDQKNRGV
jgi:hypothetical protein